MGSTQAAARARRAPAPAAPAPAPAPKKTKAAKPKTVKSSLSPASLKILLEATAGTVFSTWDNNQAKPVFIGSVTLDGVSRPVVTNNYSIVFTDTISEKTAKLLRRNVNYSAQQPNIEGLSDSIQKELRNSEEVTSNFLEKSRLNNAQVKRGKIVEYDKKRFVSLSFLLSSGKVESFDLQKVKHLAFTTGATRLEIGGSYTFFYKRNVLVGILISLDTTKGEGGRAAHWENGTALESYLVALGEQKPEIIKAPNLKTSPLRVKLAKLPGKAESLGSFFGQDAKKVKISDSENWLFCNSGGLSQAHLTASAQKFLSDYLQGFTSFRALNYEPDYDSSRRAFAEKLLRDSREAQPAFYDSVIKYKVYDGIDKVVQVITNDRTTNGLFSIERVKLLAKQLYFDEFRLINNLLYLFYKGVHVGLIPPVRVGGEIVA